MSIDNLDKKIQEAADQFEPPYNEKAWDKMEKLLDEHMPQKKGRNRKLFWIIFLLFLVGGSLIFFYQSGKNESVSNNKNNENTALKQDLKKNEKVTSNRSLPANKNATTENNNNTTSVVSSKINPLSKEVSGSQSFKNNHQQEAINGRSTIVGKTNENFYQDKSFTIKTSPSDQHQTINESRNAPGETNILRKEAVTETSKIADPVRKNDAAVQPESDSVIGLQKDMSAKSSEPAKIKKAVTSKNKFGNSFFITLSAGPDVSAITLDEIGKVKFTYGAGIGYSLGKKWNVRTGFYVEQKTYDAKPSSYNPPERFWYNYPDLKTIEADCKVYAVPVIISYNLSENSKRLWFASAGIASYFMKKEVYEYDSKTPAGQSSYTSYTVNNKNKHYFSIVRLSAGYEKKLGEHISFITEPYLAMPLAGVGFGKVKLYSSGILFTLKMKPFSNK